MGNRTLTRGECLDLLAKDLLGRVALSIDSLPAVFPVDYVVAGDSIVFSTLGDTRVAQAAIGNIVAFQVDSYESEGKMGWSVSVVGRGIQLDDADILSLMELNGEFPEPWINGDEPERFVQIRMAKLSGQTIVR